MMVGSVDSLDLCTQLSVTEERNAVPLDCWQTICLSNIWIPSHLLPSRNKPSDSRATDGILHVLKKKDHSKYLESFSVYSNSDVKSELEDIYLSDSNEDILALETTSLEESEKLSENSLTVSTDILPPLSNVCSNDTEIYNETDDLNENCKGKQDENFMVNTRASLYLDEICSNSEKRCSKVVISSATLVNSRNQCQEDNVSTKNLSESNIPESPNTFASFIEFHNDKEKDFKEDGENVNEDVQMTLNDDKSSTQSHISLNEILDNTSEVDMKDFVYDFKNISNSDFSGVNKKQELNSKEKRRKEKVKKKALKSITLDKFLEDGVNISQEDYCDKYLQEILRQENKDLNKIHIRSKVDFPDLVSEECKFIHSAKTQNEKDLDPNLKSHINHSKSHEIIQNQNILGCEKMESPITDTNIYGKIIIENIPCDVSKDDIYIILCGYGEIKDFSLISDGNLLKAYVEIDLICDIDWIVECLNGSEPFGASSQVLKCYKQQLMD